MCGRISFAPSERKIKKLFPQLGKQDQLKISYNIAPSQHTYIIKDLDDPSLHHCLWGLIPSWAKDTKKNGLNFNARVEGILSKPTFRVPFRKQRCLVPVDSFYEWRKVDKEKFPYRFKPAKGDIMYLAGIWDQWVSSNGYPVQSFSILTVPANNFVSKLHDRMPYILENEEMIKTWMDKGTTMETLGELIQSASEEFLTCYRVSKALNYLNNDTVDLHKQEPEILDLFSQF
jgi:putative SOS response-associated peptidase YedK